MSALNESDEMLRRKPATEFGPVPYLDLVKMFTSGYDAQIQARLVRCHTHLFITSDTTLSLRGVKPMRVIRLPWRRHMGLQKVNLKHIRDIYHLFASGRNNVISFGCDSQGAYLTFHEFNLQVYLDLAQFDKYRKNEFSAGRPVYLSTLYDLVVNRTIRRGTVWTVFEVFAGHSSPIESWSKVGFLSYKKGVVNDA